LVSRSFLLALPLSIPVTCLNHSKPLLLISAARSGVG
jgi:hypothetical protein